MKVFSKNIFGQYLLIKKLVIIIIGFISYHRFNKLKIKGSDNIRSLPDNNVLFVSNHQTYFADAAAMLHVFNSAINGGINTIQDVRYLFKLKLNIYFIAAKETMESGILTRILSYAGSISIQRTWRLEGKSINRKINKDDVGNVAKALKDGWVITFPQGTTTPFSPVRKGTAHIIKNNQPVVVPVVIDGFREAFDKKGLFVRNKNTRKTLIIKKPLNIDYHNESINDIVGKISCAIEQNRDEKY